MDKNKLEVIVRKIKVNLPDKEVVAEVTVRYIFDDLIEEEDIKQEIEETIKKELAESMPLLRMLIQTRANTYN